MPRSKPAASAFQAEIAQVGPEALVEITRRLLHVATSILVLLSVYTFYVSSPVACGACYHAPFASDEPSRWTEAAASSERRARDGPDGGDRRWRCLRLVRSDPGMVERAVTKRWQDRYDAALDQAALRANSAGHRRDFIGEAEGGCSAKSSNGHAKPDGTVGRRHGADCRGGLGYLCACLFSLVRGDTFLRKLVSVIPTFKDKRRTVELIRSVESDISFYLVMMLLINIGLGVGVAIITAFLGIPDPLLWGVLTVILSFAPYVGEMAIAVTLFFISMTTFDTLGKAIVVPAAYAILWSTVHLTVPVIVRRRLSLNPVAVFIAIIFLGWIWGIPGALLAVPLLASFKVICERIEHLNPIAAFLTHKAAPGEKPSHGSSFFVAGSYSHDGSDSDRPHFIGITLRRVFTTGEL